MEIARTGIILCTERYDECVAFYRDLFDLPVLHEKQQGNFRLTCLNFQGSYLMIETEGVASEVEKTVQQNPSKIRFNVTDIQAALKKIRDFGIAAKIESYEWGQTINITDPDGNRVGIRDESSFETRSD